MLLSTQVIFLTLIKIFDTSFQHLYICVINTENCVNICRKGMIIMFNRKRAINRIISSFLGTAVIVGNMLVVPAAALDLNDVGNSSSATTEQQPSSSKTTDYVSEETFQTLYGDTVISQEEAEQAAKIAAPAVKIVRVVMSVILAILPILILFNCVVDLLCLTISPLRKAMMTTAGSEGGAGAGGMGGMGGMPGMGGGMPGMGGGAPQPQGILQTLAQWASKEAIDTVTECIPTGGGMGMGMGAMGGMGAPAAPKTKSLLVTYFKKKVIMLVVFGVCLVAFSCTAFTDLGLQAGAWLVNQVGGISF